MCNSGYNPHKWNYNPTKNNRHLKKLKPTRIVSIQQNTAEIFLGTLLGIDLMEAHNVLMTIEPLQKSDFIFTQRIFLGVNVFPQKNGLFRTKKPEWKALPKETWGRK